MIWYYKGCRSSKLLTLTLDTYITESIIENPDTPGLTYQAIP